MTTGVKTLDRIAAASRPRVLDYIDLMKPELTFLSVLTTLCGFYMGMQGPFNAALFIHVGMGTALLGGGVGALNQYIERNYDALMRRTERRPLPAGRLMPLEVLVFGTSLSIIGIMQLALFTNLLTGLLAVVTFVSYVFVYTPLKRKTTLATVIGGIPGGLPPVMGWTAVRNEITPEAGILFAILFLWQMPHFYSLAWMYRKDYARAGYKMLTVLDETGQKTAFHIIIYLVALIPASIAMAVLGSTGTVYLIGAIILGIAFLVYGVFFLRQTHATHQLAAVGLNTSSRRLFFASLLYLPALMILMCVDKM